MLADFPLTEVLMSMPGIGIKTADQVLLATGLLTIFARLFASAITATGQIPLGDTQNILHRTRPWPRHQAVIPASTATLG